MKTVMWKELTARLRFFKEIVGAFMIDAAFVCAWEGIHYISGALITSFVPSEPVVIAILKYTLDYSTLAVIAFYVLGDIIRALRKLIDSLRKK